MSPPTRVGELRPSQLQHTFGIGAVVELPALSVIVMGLDEWPTQGAEPVTEPRLLAAVRTDLGPQVTALRAAPYLPETANPFDDWASSGVPVGVFPRWLRCPRCNYLGPVEAGLFKLKRDAYRPERVRYVHECSPSGRPIDALPARFLLACEAGHLDDFPWTFFVHRGSPCQSPLLRLGEYGASGEAASIRVTCTTCNSGRSMAEAFGASAAASLPRCRGRHPHLRSYGQDGCDEVPRTILLGASNMWFAERRSVLALPHTGDPLLQRVAERWAKLQAIGSLDALRAVRAYKPEDFLAFLGVGDTDLYAAIESYRSGAANAHADGKDLLGPEWEAFTHPGRVPVSDDFHLLETRPPSSFTDTVQRVVLAKRLREVSALIGFTRIGAAQDSDPGESSSGRVALTRDAPTWVPCAETRGEGIFLQLDQARLADWEARVGDSDRVKRLWRGHASWCAKRLIEPRRAWRGARYTLLHTLAHVLMREFALECGYGAAGIRERLYAGPDRAGILLYTAASDSEGTLGGLVRLGEPDILERLLRQALDTASLCSSDPMCAEHDPGADATVHGAACHACLFAAETSCERGNRFLDRALLVGTFDDERSHFFDTAPGRRAQ